MNLMNTAKISFGTGKEIIRVDVIVENSGVHLNNLHF